MSVLTETFTGLSVDEDIDTSDNDNEDFDGWYCIRTNCGPCSCCGRTDGYLHFPPFVVVWPEFDDKMIQKVFNKSKELEQNPTILAYEVSMGRCISFYNLPR